MALTLIRRGKFWYIRGSVCGVNVYRTTKLSDKPLADALRIRTESTLQQEHVFGPTASKTFDEACDAYLIAGGSDRFLAPLRQEMSSALLRNIRQPDIDAAGRRLYSDVQASTLNRQIYTPFIAVWNFAVENDWARPRRWRRPKNALAIASPRAGTKPIDYDAAARFLVAMSPAPAMLMTFLFYTGMRPSEAFSLRAYDVDVNKRWLVVRTSKTGEPRGVPVHSFLCEWLSGLIAEGGVLFKTPRGTPYRSSAGGGGQMKSAIQGARRRSGIGDISLYTARHTVSTGLVVAGVHPHIKDQILGHAVDDMSRHYTNVPQGPLIDAIDKLPVPDAIRTLPWVADPKFWQRRLAEGTGRRTDLEEKNSNA